MFFVALFALLLGFPVAFTFGGIALIFGVWTEGFDMFAFMPYRIQSIMENTELMAVLLFVFMGLVLQKTHLAEQLLESMGRLFGGVRGGIAISTVLVGALLAASTGETVTKLSYSAWSDKWDWMIGTGLYIEEVSQDVATMQQAINHNIDSIFFSIVVILTITVAVIIVITLAINLHEHRLADRNLNELAHKTVLFQEAEKNMSHENYMMG